MLKSDRFSCSQKIRLKRDPPVLDFCGDTESSLMIIVTFLIQIYLLLQDVVLVMTPNHCASLC